MASSLIRGLLAQGQPAQSIWATDVDVGKLESLAQDCGINSADTSQIAASADVIVLAVKPQVMQSVCESLATVLAGTDAAAPLVVSIAAGITIAHIEHHLGSDTAIVRCMPNTPALIGKGASASFANAQVTKAQKALADKIMQAVGISVWVDRESDIDTVTAVSGSGPAYFFLFMEAMQNTATSMGLSDEVARALVYQTAVGAAELALTSTESIDELRRRVTSPGGTTEQAIKQFESDGIRELVDRALKAARDRSIELADEINK
ncbi:MAG: pyrroline-5-carboxylate reductase [Proteobacteria bacterium]|nr:pyrroline-5-carboxylate reductase [Pseudomonadota bacterium]